MKRRYGIMLDPTIQQVALKAKSDKKGIDLIMKSLFGKKDETEKERKDER